MGRVTLRLPESLHASLAERAEQEGVSLNQLLVYALTSAVTVEPVREQRRRFDEIVARTSSAASETALSTLLAQREPAPRAPKRRT